jgi:hypothetical protein
MVKDYTRATGHLLDPGLAVVRPIMTIGASPASANFRVDGSGFAGSGWAGKMRICSLMPAIPWDLTATR